LEIIYRNFGNNMIRSRKKSTFSYFDGVRRVAFDKHRPSGADFNSSMFVKRWFHVDKVIKTKKVEHAMIT
jgi:hypothetical protein